MNDNKQFEVRIPSQLGERFRFGCAPYWNILLTNISFPELSDNSITHIENLIIDGFTQGEIIEDKIEGWWQLKMDI